MSLLEEKRGVFYTGVVQDSTKPHMEKRKSSVLKRFMKTPYNQSRAYERECL